MLPETSVFSVQPPVMQYETLHGRKDRLGPLLVKYTYWLKPEMLGLRNFQAKLKLRGQSKRHITAPYVALT
jgi:hypothetical protein